MCILDRYFKCFTNKIFVILFIVFLILLSFFFGLSKVHAVTNIVTNDLSFPSTYFIRDCSSPTNCTSNVALGYDAGFRFWNSSSVSIGTSGVDMVYKLPDVLQPDYLYSITSYVCQSSSTDFDVVSNVGPYNNSLNGTYNYRFYSKSGLFDALDFLYYNNSGQLVNMGQAGYDKCRWYNLLISPDVPNYWVSLHFTNETLVSSNYLSFVGYTISNLGAYSSSLIDDIDNVISNSDLATSEDLKAVEDKISEMTSEQKVTNDKLDDLNDNITSDDTSGGESQGSSFFNDFAVNDNGGISGIITSPLNVINKMLEGNTCESLTFNLSFLGKNKEISLPSGCILWNKASQSAVIIYQTLLCGLFSYILATNLFKDIEKLKNPKESEVDTLDL